MVRRLFLVPNRWVWFCVYILSIQILAMTALSESKVNSYHRAIFPFKDSLETLILHCIFCLSNNSSLSDQTSKWKMIKQSKQFSYKICIFCRNQFKPGLDSIWLDTFSRLDSITFFRLDSIKFFRLYFWLELIEIFSDSIGFFRLVC